MKVAEYPYYKHDNILRTVKPITPSQAIRPQTQQTRTLTYEDIADLDNLLQKMEWQHRQMGEALSNFRSEFNRVVIPL